MRNVDVCEEFARGNEANGSNLSTDGERLWSYGTVIAQRVRGRVIMNLTKYSVTTSRHQNYMRRALRYVETETVTGKPRGVYDLTR